MSIWNWLFQPSALSAERSALQAGSDVLIGVALLGIAAALLVFFLLRRPRFAWMGWLFAPLFIASAMSHFVAAYTQGSPAFGVELLIKLASALVAAGTASFLWMALPKFMPTPSVSQLSGANAELAATVEQRTAELVETNERLTRSEAQYRVSFEAATVGKVQSDPTTGTILRANPAFAAMLDYEPWEVVGKSGWELVWPEDRADEQTAFARVTSGELAAYVREKRFMRRDGTPVWARVSANIVSVPESGQPDITVAVIENIDERHKTQAALEVTRRELEDVVVERTAALVQRDLLLREVYHRVKNNLQVVDSILVMQAKQLADPAAKRTMASLRGRIYALGLVHHQLMGSANLQTFDVAPFLRELSGNIVDGGAAPGVSLSVQADPLDVGLDFAIPLGLLVTELVTNALKHAFPGGEGHIAVGLTRNPDGTFALVVADDGTGYDGDAGPLGASTSGLGSKIITGLVSQLKGTMNIQSDHGTRAEVLIAAAA